LVERIWWGRSEGGGSFISRAASQWEMVVTRQHDRSTLTVRGPETTASLAPIPADAAFVGITFRLGTVLPHLPPGMLVDGDVTLPDATRSSFWLVGGTWPFPDYDTADTFVARLVREGLLVQDPVVAAALAGHEAGLSPRSMQRRIVRATELTRHTIRQIERAHAAAALLAQGVAILDVVDHLGYADQPHLTRSLRRFIGDTPAHLLRQGRPA
jgi:AraC-like DNA-binding protein